MTLSDLPGSLVPPADWANNQQEGDAPLTPVFLIMATVLGAVLRFYSLTGQSLWVDEMLTWNMIRPGIGAGYLEQLLDSIQGPLYMAVTWPLIRLQDTPFMLRLPAAVAGVLTIPFFGIFVGRVMNGRAAKIAVLLLALSPFHIWYSQEARGYAFLMLFSVLMGLMIHALVRSKAGGGAALLFALVSACAVWSNLGGMFLWAGMGLGILLFHFPAHKKEWGFWILAFGTVLVLVCPWLLKASGIWAVDRIVPGSGTGEALRGETTFSILAWPYTIQTFFYGYSFGPSLRELHQPDRMAVLQGYLPLFVMGGLPVGLGLLAALLRMDRQRVQLLVWIMIPVLVLTVLAMRNVKPWNPRYIAMAFPWVLALTAFGLAKLPRRIGAGLVVLLIGLTLWSLGGYYGNGKYAKADVRAAAAFLDASAVQGELILVPSVTSVFDYYYEGTAEVRGTYGLPALLNAEDAGEFCDQILEGRTRCRLVLAREWYFDPDGLLPVAMARRGHLRLSMSADGIRVFTWEQAETNETAP